ncbi:MAG: hypothetical protein COA99_03820 [Moraxellaceae bacterium]|nr:MAG: hypothetical protein COA99_03820 [Moraxellaceae bacterium]
MYKGLVLSVMFSFLLGCGGSGGSSGGEVDTVRDMDLTGTWDFIEERRVHKKSTGEYLYSEYSSLTYILEETEDGTTYGRCWDYGRYLPFAVKTDDHLYFSINDSGYYLVGENAFEHNETISYEWNPGIEYLIVDTITKKSEDILVDSGGFELNGPVSLNEQSHVCVNHNFSDLGDSQSYEVIVPFGDDTISLYLAYHGNLLVGSYEYEEYSDVNQIYGFDVSSTATEFDDSVGSNILAPTSALITISESNDFLIKGEFSFVGQFGNDYSGSFEINIGEITH